MIIASGSLYRDRFPLEIDGTKTDFMQAYLEHVFRFIGFTDMRTIRVMPTGIPGPKTEEMAARCEEEAHIAAKEF
jgi:FMN-dependent NADH-azoreductase